MASRFTTRPQELQRLREAAAFGVLNLMFAIEGAAKRHTPVRGGFRSFAPNGPVGGTLRRSEHSVVYLDGVKIAGPDVDENGNPVPDYVPDSGIVGYTGTNVDYAVYVHNGTVKMEARPFLTEGFLEVKDQAPALIAAGARRHLGQGGA